MGRNESQAIFFDALRSFDNSDPFTNIERDIAFTKIGTKPIGTTESDTTFVCAYICSCFRFSCVFGAMK